MKDELDVATELIVSYQTELQQTQEAHKSAIMLLCDNADRKMRESSIDIEIFDNLLDQESTSLFYHPHSEIMQTLNYTPKRIWKFDDDWDSDHEPEDSWWRVSPSIKEDSSTQAIAKNYFSGKMICLASNNTQTLNKGKIMMDRSGLKHELRDKKSEPNISTSSWLFSSIVGKKTAKSSINVGSSFEPDESSNRFTPDLSATSWLPSLSNMISVRSLKEVSENDSTVERRVGRKRKMDIDMRQKSINEKELTSNEASISVLSASWIPSFGNTTKSDEYMQPTTTDANSLDSTGWLPSIFGSSERTAGAYLVPNDMSKKNQSNINKSSKSNANQEKSIGRSQSLLLFQDPNLISQKSAVNNNSSTFSWISNSISGGKSFKDKSSLNPVTEIIPKSTDDIASSSTSWLPSKVGERASRVLESLPSVQTNDSKSKIINQGYVFEEDGYRAPGTAKREYPKLSTEISIPNHRPEFKPSPIREVVIVGKELVNAGKGFVDVVKESDISLKTVKNKAGSVISWGSSLIKTSKEE